MKNIEIVSGSSVNMDDLIASWSSSESLQLEKSFDNMDLNDLNSFCIPNLPCPNNWSCTTNLPCPHKDQCWCPGGQ